MSYARKCERYFSYMNEDIFLSIIIPVYNCPLEQLSNCIESILPLTVSHEIIIINDGSKETFSSQYSEYLKNIHFVKYIVSENGGVSSARNKGIDLSKGKYLFFLDADDAISNEYIKFINENHTKFTADWILSGVEMRYIHQNKTEYRSFGFEHNKTPEIFDVDYGKILKIRAASKDLNECWGKFIKRDIIQKNNIKFPINVLSSEDVIFNTRLLSVIYNIQYVSVCGYIYNYIPNINKRVLKEHYKRFENIKLKKHEFDSLVEMRTSREDAKALIRDNNINIIIDIIQDCMTFYKAGIFDTRMKRFLREWSGNNNIFQYVSCSVCKGIKTKIYYLILRYKLWICISIISGIKSILMFGKKKR